MAGAGFASGLHLAGWKRLDRAEVVAICDPGVDKANARAREFGIPGVFDTATAMLDATKPDALDIVAPMSEHVALCRLAAARGVHVLCQKPLAPSVAEGQALARDIDGRVRLMVHENWRFRAQYRQVKHWLDEGALGEPVSCSMQVRSSGLIADSRGVRPQLVRQPFCATLERYMIGEVLIHHLDVLRWLLGPLRVVAARTGRVCPDIRGEDRAVILLEGQACTAVLEGNHAVPGARATMMDRFELVGTLGTAVFEGNVVQLQGKRNESLTLDLASGYEDSYAAAIAHFAEALTRDAPFETGIEDNLRTMMLVEDAYAIAPTTS
jgi:predicted dehydrogenase